MKKKKAAPATHISMADLVQFNKAAHEVTLATVQLSTAVRELEVARLQGDKNIRAAKDVAEQACAAALGLRDSRASDVDAARERGRALAKRLSESYAVDLMLNGIDTDTGEIVAHPKG